jgi:hypothetical protein
VFPGAVKRAAAGTAPDTGGFVSLKVFPFGKGIIIFSQTADPNADFLLGASPRRGDRAFRSNSSNPPGFCGISAPIPCALRAAEGCILTNAASHSANGGPKI